MRSGSLGGPTRPANAVVLFALFATLLGGCGDPRLLDAPPDLRARSGAPDAASMDAGDAGQDASTAFPDTGIGATTLIVSRVVPEHGPFSGGNTALVRGAGFTEDSFVEVGGRLVQPAETVLIDANRLQITLPAGEPGPADVTVRVGARETTLPGGYTYDQLAVEPTQGPVSGGTVLDIQGSGTAFEEGDQVFIGGVACDALEIVSATRLSCRTPPSPVGTFDVELRRAVDGSAIVVEDGFTYFDSTDPFGGGLGGGPAEGSINISVIDAFTGLPVPDAYVVLGDDFETEHQGPTNVLGQVSFFGEDVIGDLTVHIAKHCYEKTSFVAFDAKDVTTFLTPWTDPMCGMGGGLPPAGRGVRGAFVSGELIFFGPNELGPNPWDNIPPPRDNEVKVAYVFTTQRCAGDSPSCRNPDPSLGGAKHRVLETDVGTRGYPYRIFARPASLAVYALAGVEHQITGEFTPYVMGVGRNVLAGPGDEVEGVEIIMNIPLDHTLDVRLEDIPQEARTGPDRFRVNADLDLGGEGFITRFINGEAMDTIRRRSGAEQTFRLFAQPALLGALEDGRYRIQAGWVTGDFDGDPSTEVVRTGVREVDREVVIGDFLGIPQAVTPDFGERIPEDRVLRWESDGPPADLHVVLMTGGDGNPAWRHFVPGDVYEAPVPDFSKIPELSDISSGFVTWVVFAVRIPGFDFDEFSYRFLNSRYWSAWAVDVFTAQQ